MKGGGDFSNNFDRHIYQHKHFTRVLTQQGKVQLDADANEQAAILWHYLRTLTRDLIGRHGGPFSEKRGSEIEPGFKIVIFTDQGRITDLCISQGRYYVNGLLCENEQKLRESEEVDAIQPVTYYSQPDYPLDKDQDRLPDPPFLVYLHAWERHVSAVEDPSIREVALGASGPDTATRAKLVWQVKATNESPGGSGDDTSFPVTRDEVEELWDQWVEEWQPTNRGKLKARAKEDTDEDTNPCTVSPEARFRGVQNHLYRVEIHRGGTAWDGSEQGRDTAATFKWSRENGSIEFPIRSLEGNVATLEHLGRDSRLSLEVGDLVEPEDKDYILRGRAEPLLRVEAIDPIDMRVTLGGTPSAGDRLNLAKYPLLRRWDHGAGDSKRDESEQVIGTLLVEEDSWIELEDGVQIYFQGATAPGIIEHTPEEDQTLLNIAETSDTPVEELLCLNPFIQDPNLVLPQGHTLKVPAGTDGATLVPHRYQTGDYWLVPARTATGDVEWPGDIDQPEAQPPHGIEHHYAPLAVVVSAENNENHPVDCRYRFRPLRECCPPFE